MTKYVSEDTARKQLITSILNRSDLIKRRKKLVVRPFYIWRPRLKRVVSGIDARLDVIDKNIRYYRSILLGKKPVKFVDGKVRFYVSEGWTLDCLSPYVHGDILVHQEIDDKFFTIPTSSEVSVDILYAAEVMGTEKEYFKKYCPSQE